MKKIALMLLLVGFAAVCGCAAMQQTQETVPLPQKITESSNCPVCGMFPARYAQWQAQLIYQDGQMRAFDGCKDLFRYLLQIDKYEKAYAKEDIAVVYVKDFKGGQWIDAKAAHFVLGSKILGPMGREIIPFAKHMEAMNFQERNGGKMVHFAQITLDMIRSLNKAPRKKMPNHGTHHHKKKE